MVAFLHFVRRSVSPTYNLPPATQSHNLKRILLNIAYDCGTSQEVKYDTVSVSVCASIGIGEYKRAVRVAHIGYDIIMTSYCTDLRFTGGNGDHRLECV